MALQAVIGRRVRLIVPVGLEKRVAGDLDELTALINAPGAHGPRLLSLPGEVVTELEALALLTGASAQLVAGGGVCGAEGSVWLAFSGDPEQEAAARRSSSKRSPARRRSPSDPGAAQRRRRSAAMLSFALTRARGAARPWRP